MKVLMVGETGQLARFIQLTRCDTELVGESLSFDSLTREQLDLAYPGKIKRILDEHSFDVLINTAAYTAVDKAESEPKLAYTINAEAPGEMAKVCAEREVPFVHYSTDYVFPGDASTPYREADATGPDSIYGKSKLKGEEFVSTIAQKFFIFRTAWVYGEFGSNFFMTMRRLASERDSLSVVSDQVGGPTYARSIAECSWQVINKLQHGANLPWGIYHMTCGGEVSWFGFAEALLEQSGFQSIKLSPLTTQEYPTPAKRPAYSILDNRALNVKLGVNMPDWREALQSCIQHADGVIIDPK